MIYDYLRDFLNLVFPDQCVLCNSSLLKLEKEICNTCYIELPRLENSFLRKQQLEKIFAGRINLLKLDCFLKYSKTGISQKLITELKYNGNSELAFSLGAWHATEHHSAEIFSFVDVIIPVPLHEKKMKIRGHNQAERIASGISKIINKPVLTDVLERVQNNNTQTRKGRMDRQTNLENVFILKRADKIKEKKVLLVDDVLTTGATLESCANELFKANLNSLSIVTTAYSC